MALLLLVLAFSPPVSAQSERYDGLPIRQIEWRGLRTLSEDSMEHYLLGPARGGERRLDLNELNQHIHQLWDRELIDDISVAAEPSGDGVKLIVTVVERPVLVSINYVGMKRVSRSDIVEKIDKERIGVYEGQPLARGELQRLKGAIEDMFKEKGYRFAQVSYTLEEVAIGQMRASFTIDEGDKVKIGDINFDGNTVYGDWRLRQSMKKTKESGLITRILKKDIYNPANIEEDLDKVRDLYRKAGYKDVIIARPEIEVDAKRPDAPTVEEQKRRLVVTIPIEEGERWRLGEITLEGNKVFSDELLLRQFESPRGGWLRSKVVDDGVEKIDKLYKSVGFVFAEVRPELVDRDSNVADLVVHVDEADQYRVGRMIFDGNSKTRDKVLRREMLVQEGTVMNMNALQSSLLKIRQLNYFALDEEEPIQFDFDNEKKLVNVTVQGEEADRTELQFGGGWSEVDGFFGQFAMRTQNFLGRGETVGISVQTGRQRNVYSLEYRIPWFLDKPQSLGFSLFRQDYDTPILNGVDFRQKYSGGAITYGRGLGPFQSLNLSYSFTDVQDVRTAIGADGMPITADTQFTISSLRPFWVYDTIDSRFEPTRGLRLTGSVEYAGTFLGGDSEFVKPVVGLTYFKPVSRRPFRSSLGINVEAGLIDPLAGSELAAQQRFFLGGENSVRGFRRRSIVVRQDDGEIARDILGFPVGGETFLQANLEYHVLVGGPFRMVFFGDAGGVFGFRQPRRDAMGQIVRDAAGNIVFAEGKDFDLGALRYSAGIELRILVPLFGAPLRFIYSTNLDPLEDDQFESFDFNIGTSF
ncbi:MAG: outer membrane protein assembly factor BamA [Thermoanaerobaculia bacterium]|nr:outer membrane protein assembly factor BamA [Thermoanaerobaculia bacterium]